MVTIATPYCHFLIPSLPQHHPFSSLPPHPPPSLPPLPTPSQEQFIDMADHSSHSGHVVCFCQQLSSLPLCCHGQSFGRTAGDDCCYWGKCNPVNSCSTTCSLLRCTANPFCTPPHTHTQLVHSPPTSFLGQFYAGACCITATLLGRAYTAKHSGQMLDKLL